MCTHINKALKTIKFNCIYLLLLSIFFFVIFIRSSDEHGTFPERFYDRTTTRVSSDSEFIRRTGYHETGRGRNRDRGYRNGPYNALSMDRHRPINNTWSSYDVSSSSSSTTRYNSTTGSQTDTGYSTTPTETTERRNSDQGAKKKTKSRSGSGSPSPSGSTSSRSPSRYGKKWYF